MNKNKRINVTKVFATFRLESTNLAAYYACVVDMDECQAVNECTNGADCRNTNGSYECICPIGTTLENDGRTCRGKRFVFVCKCSDISKQF